MCLLHHFAHPSVAHAYTVCSLPVQASNIFREFRQTPDLWRKYDADRSAMWFDLQTDMVETFGDDVELARAVERDARVRSRFEAVLRRRCGGFGASIPVVSGALRKYSGKVLTLSVIDHEPQDDHHDCHYYASSIQKHVVQNDVHDHWSKKH